MEITNLKIVFTGLFQKFDRLSTAWVKKNTKFLFVIIFPKDFLRVSSLHPVFPH